MLPLFDLLTGVCVKAVVNFCGLITTYKGWLVGSSVDLLHSFTSDAEA